MRYSMTDFMRKIYILLFSILVVLLSVLSLFKLADYYVKDTAVNNNTANSTLSRLETDQISNFFYKMGFVKLNGLMRNVTGQHEMNHIIKLNNGYLSDRFDYIDDSVLKDYADSVAAVSDYLAEYNVPSLFVMAPYTTSKYDPQLPIGIEDYGNDNIDRFIAYLQEDGVDTMDMRQVMHDDGIDQYSMMYKTDTHWTTEAGFYAAGKIEEYLVNRLGCQVDERVMDINNYEIRKYPKWHLGVRGLRTSVGFAGSDDFDLFIPKFDSNITYGELSGNMQDVAYRWEFLDKRRENVSAYDGVLENITDNYTNNDCNNDAKIVFITDSFYRAVGPFMILDFKEPGYMYNLLSNEITPDFFANVQPDAVVFLYYSGATVIENSEAFSFQGFR